jgi:hypothetical protein
MSEIRSPRPWKRFSGSHRYCAMLVGENVISCEASCGIVTTGRTDTFHGYFCRLVEPSGREWLGENRYSLRGALAAAATASAADGWKLLAVGLSPDFLETGLSENSGWGFHFDFPAAVHMLEMPIAQHHRSKRKIDEQ